MLVADNRDTSKQSPKQEPRKLAVIVLRYDVSRMVAWMLLLNRM